MIETSVGNFELIKDDNNIFVIADFENKYVEILDRYEFIVGDYSQDKLRLKGFNRIDLRYVPDYINEYCSLESQYYIIQNPSFDANKIISEE